MQLLPFTKEERRLWRQWTRQGITGRDRRKLLKHERRKARKLQGYLQKREITKKNEREKARKLQGHVQEREITKKNEREADIFIACLLGVPFILVVLVVAKTEHSHPLGMVVSTHFRCGKGVKRGLKNGALPFTID